VKKTSFITVMNIKNKLHFTVPALLILVALIQIWFVYTNNLTPWKGGGFGMFASIDRMERRPVHITITASDRVFAVDPGNLVTGQNEMRKIQSMPNNRRLNELAGNVMAASWTIDSSRAVSSYSADEIIGTSKYQKYLLKPVFSKSDAAGLTLISADLVSVEVFRMNYDTNNQKLSLKSLNRVVLGRLCHTATGRLYPYHTLGRQSYLPDAILDHGCCAIFLGCEQGLQHYL
jgi:hypothetical protein